MYETILEILKLAMVMEETDRELYTRMKDMIPDPKTQSVFEELAEFEKTHSELLFKKFRLHGGDPAFLPKSDEEILKEYVLPQSFDRTSILQNAIGREIRSENLYRNAATKTDDAILQDFCFYLANEEKDHAKTLRDLLEMDEI
ncbi:MAG TPA: ferritin family protein [Candidatus Sumerlaeota bacterium]|nr:ferritin family protein [Candidatus Sumerlaeota bacterium]HON48976.1 ferritin family protein [Candidatus Sumerlaeota bacterium]HOR65730.1 ferritin family protein [Candidatus Sumerlaeota bacterium]HPL75436.1 ferritin family protein [Candidatus Sumerlaeota bacterium]HRU53279.1 ferritin family protein [Candidatus Sumerlaeia bacterium]